MCFSTASPLPIVAAIISAGAAITAAYIAIHGQRKTLNSLEQFKTTLARELFQFSKLHEKRMDRIIEVYDLLLDLQGELHRYLLLVRYNVPPHQGEVNDIAARRTAAYELFFAHLGDAWVVFRRRKFYFEKPVIASVEAVFDKLHKIEQEVFGYQNTTILMTDQGYMKEVRDKFKEDLDKAQEILQGDLHNAILSLEHAIQELVGVKS